MKSIIYVILFLVGLSIKAQQEELINNTWYLQKVIIDNIEYFQPSNWESSETIELFFEIDNDNTHMYANGICRGCISDLQSLNSETFTYNNESCFTLEECGESENIDFDDLFMSVYCYSPNSNGESDVTIDYTIINTSTEYQILTVSNTLGHQAIYTSVNLSVEDIENTVNDISLHPNPVKDKLFIENLNLNENYIISISNLNGQNVLQKEISTNSTEIDISTLEKGIYFVSVYNASNKLLQTQKFIKD